jgi:peptide chain release factor 1
MVFHVEGKEAKETFKDEMGGHRWQRVPPNDKRGRVQTSTVTVAVLPEPSQTEVVLREADIEWQATKGSGAGGQARNKTSSAVQMRHIPTGLTVRCEGERSQHHNRESAIALLRAKIWEAKQALVHGTRAADRRAQVGSGMRGDKRRTIRTQDGVVNDHITNKTWRYKDYVRGVW